MRMVRLPTRDKQVTEIVHRHRSCDLINGYDERGGTKALYKEAAHVVDEVFETGS